MKKKLLVALSILLTATLTSAIWAFAATDIKLFVNGKQSNAALEIIEDSSYVPLRAVAEMLGADVHWDGANRQIDIVGKPYDVTLFFPLDKYPETGTHILNAIAKGETPICTINRQGAEANRENSLKGIPTKDGYDRDEWPMAMCFEGGTGADIAYVTSSDNRGAGSWVGNSLEGYQDGTRVLFVVADQTKIINGTATVITPQATVAPSPSPAAGSEVIYNSCAEVKAAGKAPIRAGDPGYSTKLDRDGDGVACES